MDSIASIDYVKTEHDVNSLNSVFYFLFVYDKFYYQDKDIFLTMLSCVPGNKMPWMDWF